jgi:hypothetical protein
MTWMNVAMIGGGTALLSGAMQGQAAKDAAGQIAGGSRYAADINKQMFDITNENLRPYREAGTTTLKDLLTRMPELTRGYTAADFAQGIDPGYQFRLAQGQKAFENQANRGGGLIGGNVMQGMQDYTQGQASQEFGNAFARNASTQTNIFNRLKGIADMGLGAAGTTGEAALRTGESMGSAGLVGAQAQAAGDIGSARAYGNTLQSMGNMASLPYYMQPGAQPGSQPMTTNYGTGANYGPPTNLRFQPG